jgi:hypothetical protein
MVNEIYVVVEWPIDQRRQAQSAGLARLEISKFLPPAHQLHSSFDHIKQGSVIIAPEAAEERHKAYSIPFSHHLHPSLGPYSLCDWTPLAVPSLPPTNKHHQPYQALRSSETPRQGPTHLL